MTSRDFTMIFHPEPSISGLPFPDPTGSIPAWREDLPGLRVLQALQPALVAQRRLRQHEAALGEAAAEAQGHGQGDGPSRMGSCGSLFQDVWENHGEPG